MKKSLFFGIVALFFAIAAVANDVTLQYIMTDCGTVYQISASSTPTQACLIMDYPRKVSFYPSRTFIL